MILELQRAWNVSCEVGFQDSAVEGILAPPKWENLKVHQKVVLPMYVRITHCIIYYSIDKAPQPKQLTWEAFNWASDFRRLESMMAEQKHGDRNGLEFTSRPISRRQKDSALDGGRGWTHSNTPFLTRAHLLVLPKQPPTGDQVSKWGLKGNISVRPPHRNNCGRNLWWFEKAWLP